jgi:DNA helicase-2/ATP-dependent DNA helicase PcrA
VREEALDISQLQQAPDAEIRALGSCFEKYEALLIENNQLDFSGIQYEALQLLQEHSEVLEQLRFGAREE